MGTNIYYEEIDQNVDKEANAFKQQAPISLKYLNKSNKILKLQPCKLPDTLYIPESENVDLKFNEEYQTVMRKMKEGCLNIEDLIEKNNESKPMDIAQSVAITQDVPEVKENLASTESASVLPIASLEDATASTTDSLNVNHDLEFIKELIKKPMRSENVDEEVEIANVNRENYTYSVLKQLYLQNLHYKDLPLNILDAKLHLYVDIENSVKKGVVNKSNFQRLTDEEKNKLISLDNIENLAPPLQLALLVNQLNEQKKLLANMSADDLKVLDDYERTPKERYRILKYLAKDVWYHIFTRHKDGDLMAKKN